MLPQGKDEEKDELRGRKGGETESMERENGADGKEKGRWRRGAALGRAKTKSSAFQLDCEFSAPENVIISLNTAHHS